MEAKQKSDLWRDEIKTYVMKYISPNSETRVVTTDSNYARSYNQFEFLISI